MLLPPDANMEWLHIDPEEVAVHPKYVAGSLTDGPPDDAVTGWHMRNMGLQAGVGFGQRTRNVGDGGISDMKLTEGMSRCSG